MKQRQFLDVVDRDEAERRFRAASPGAPGGGGGPPRRGAGPRAGRRRARRGGRAGLRPVQRGRLRRARRGHLRRRGGDPLRLRLEADAIAPGVAPGGEVLPGAAASLATGGMLPRGADAVVMVEDTDVEGDVIVSAAGHARARPSPFAGTDIGRGETVLRPRATCSRRGRPACWLRSACDRVAVRSPARVAILSTGDEIVAPASRCGPGWSTTATRRILADAVRELGGEPLPGRRRATTTPPRARRSSARSRAADLVLLSGGTSKGEGDLNARVVGELEPGIVVHGVALKPGKPLCLAARTGGRPSWSFPASRPRRSSPSTSSSRR